MRNFDRILKRTAEFGPFQRWMVAALCLAASVVDNFNGFSLVFLAYGPRHRCDANATLAALNGTQRHNLFQARPDEFSASILDPCNKMLDHMDGVSCVDSREGSLHLRWKSAVWSSRGGAEATRAFPAVSGCTTEVSSTGLSSPTSTSSVIKPSFPPSSSPFSKLLQSPPDSSTLTSLIGFSPLSHNLVLRTGTVCWLSWGRKRAFLFNISTYLVGSLVSSFMPTLWSFTAVRCLAEMNALATFNICYIWALELVGPSKRTLTSTIFYLGGAAGKMSMSLVAWLSPTWRVMSLTLAAPALPFLLYAFLPESPSWLLSQGRDEEAIDVLLRIAGGRRTRAELQHLVQFEKASETASSSSSSSEGSLDSSCSGSEEEGEEISTLELLKEPRLRLKSLLLCLVFLSVMVVTDTIAFNTENLGGNFPSRLGSQFLCAGTSSLADLKAAAIELFLCPRHQRRWSTSFC